MTIEHIKTILVLLLSIVMLTSALAHDTWLLAHRSAVPSGTSIKLDLTSGMRFPALDSAINPDRVERAAYRLAGKTSEIVEYRPAPRSLLFSVQLADRGIATIWVSLKPRSLELMPSKVQEYLDEIDAPTEIRRLWAETRGAKKWREVYRKHSKTYVRVGELQVDNSWLEPVGMALEIIPEKNPMTLRVNDDFPVQVLKDGSPLPEFSVGIIHGGSSKGIMQKTNSEGRVIFKLNRGGRWLIRGTDLRKSTQPGVDWESDFTTLTINVNFKKM